MLIPQWLIEKKRDRHELSQAEISEFISGYSDGTVPDYQMAAMAMAIYLNGMSFEETAHLTRAMMDSGTVLDTSSLANPVADKHSTGGIGDKLSLILAPLVACCGVDIPMISGRGLGITGGTLDKLESIPGYRTDLDEQAFLAVIRKVGCAIIGQTSSLAPADKKLYALRDVTATVPSIPLITASIMCKKLAEGLDALVLDVKCGRGAFMKSQDDARSLATNMVRVGQTMGKRVGALLTRMDQPLGHCIGNALEVRESIACLRGEVSGPMLEVTLELSALMLELTGRTSSRGEAMTALRRALDSGDALVRFQDMIAAQGGDPRVVDAPERLPSASARRAQPAPRAGIVSDIDAEAFGRAVLLLGGGRTRTDDRIDFAVGVSDLVQVGQPVQQGDPLFILHSNDATRAAEASRLLEHAVTIEDHAAPELPWILERITPGEST